MAVRYPQLEYDVRALNRPWGCCTRTDLPPLSPGDFVAPFLQLSDKLTA